MSWSYLPEQAAGSTEVCCSDTLPFALLKSWRKTARSCCNGSETGSCRDFRYGTTCAPLTDCHGAESLTSSAEDSPAPTSARQEKAQESTASSQDYGGKWRVSFARFDRDTCSWRTAQCCLFGGLDKSSVIWPRSGMTVDGRAYLLQTVERPTRETGSGYWQTPVADDCVDRKDGKFNSRGEPKLSAQVKLAPTPKASDADKGGRGELLHYVKTGHPMRIPTPRANDAEKRGNFDATNPRNGLAGFVRQIPTQSAAGGRLNPEWVEWLMGWPIGSTAFLPLEMDKYHEFTRQHGGC